MNSSRLAHALAVRFARRATAPALICAAVFAAARDAAAFQGSDACSSAQAILGASSFFVETTFATTGVEGQSGGCGISADGAIEHDVWFWWASSTFGRVTLSTCDGFGFDTKIKVYAGAGCPSAPALACSDDACGVRSNVAFIAEPGKVYTFQVGAKPGALFGVVGATLAIESPNACVTPLEISGRGQFTFDNSLATNGAAGQFEALCDQSASTAINHDVWYRWISPSNGTASISTCGLTAVDTKIAVYPAPAGGGCPTSAALACNDDACGFQSSLDFACVAGAEYMIQLGTYDASPGGPGAFRIEVDGADWKYDGGVAHGSYGFAPGGATCWFQKFGTHGETTVLSTISAVYGQSTIPGLAPPNGTPSIVAVWEDPDDDWNPDDAVLVRTQASAVDNVDTDVFNTTNLVPPVVVHGSFFVGVVVAHGPNQYPIPIDMSYPATARSWWAGNATADFDLANLQANTMTPQDIGASMSPIAAFLLRVGAAPATGSYDFCHSGVANFSCSANGAGCANGFYGHGCANSANPSGATLAAIGSTNVLSDSARLLASSLPPFAPALFFQGTSPGAIAVPFGDGMRCVAGQVIRLGTRAANAQGNVSYGYGVGGDLPVHERGLVGAPGWRSYQVWYRNAASFCSNATFNLTNGLALEWR